MPSLQPPTLDGVATTTRIRLKKAPPISILGAGSCEVCIALVSLQARISRNDAWVNDGPGVVSYISLVSLMLIGTSNTSAVEELYDYVFIYGLQVMATG